MKLVKRQIDRDGRGTIVVCPTEPEDLWHAFHLVAVGDRVRTTTTRKVIREGVTGSTSSSKVKITLTIEVRSLDFDADSCVLHIAGVNVEESQHVKLGQHHTLHLELNRNFRLTKENFDSVTLERLEDACNPARAAEVAAVALEPGLAHLCLISGHMTITRARVEMTIPKKRAGASNHGKAMTRFHEALYQAVLRHVDFGQIKCVLVGSPGFANQDFLKYLNHQAVVRDDKALVLNKAKFVACHASSGHKRAVAEMLAIPEVAKQLLDTRVVGDVAALERFFKMLHTDEDRAYYGYNHVLRADEQLAVDTLMVTDTLFKSSDVATRQQYVQLVESVREHGGAVHIFSSLHVSGEQLAQLSGIAAILRFPMPDLDEGEGESESDSEDEAAGGGGGGSYSFAQVAPGAAPDNARAAAETEGDFGGQGHDGELDGLEVESAEEEEEEPEVDAAAEAVADMGL